MQLTKKFILHFSVVFVALLATGCGQENGPAEYSGGEAMTEQEWAENEDYSKQLEADNQRMQTEQSQ